MKNTPVTQAIETGNIQRIAIKHLVKSPLNVRKKGSSGIGELAALIAAQGLIHNLVVTEQKKKNKRTGSYEVVAGGRRLDALNLLVAEERLSKESEVNCRVVGAEALELSLTENSGREAMHPADLLMAYRNLTEAGLSPDEIAPRFGVSPLTVKRYLKLTHVSPAIFKRYAEDEINFEQISALALTDDHELQERIWNSTPEWQRSGSNFRRLITGTEIDIRHSPLAKFVGLEKYEAAGGLVRRDLFGKEDEGYIQDAELLESLALEKLNHAVEALKSEGHAWAQCHTTFDHADRAEFVKARTIRRESTAEEQAAMDALAAEMEAIEAEFEGYDEEADEDGETYSALEKKSEAIRGKIDALHQSLEELNAADLAIAGVIVTVDPAGELRIERGLIRKEDVKKLPKEQGAETWRAGSGQSEAAKPVHSEKLTRMLTAHRSAAIQAEIMNRPEVALAALVYQLALQVFGSSYRTNRIVQVNLEQTYLKKEAENIEQSRAGKAIEEKRVYWTERIEAAGQGGKTLFGWLLERDLADLHDLLGFCTAVSINTVSGREHAPSDDVAAIMTTLNLDMADWWEATTDTYLSHVSKDRVIGMVSDAVSPQVAQTLTKLKKGELVKAAEEHLSGLRWLPDNFKARIALDRQ